MALINKWKWRCLSDHDTIWYGIINQRYNNLDAQLVDLDCTKLKSNSSLWWIYILDIGKHQGVGLDWFSSNIACRVGSGNKMLFWTHKWRREKPLYYLFLDVFKLFINKWSKVQYLGFFKDDIWNWNFQIKLESVWVKAL